MSAEFFHTEIPMHIVSSQKKASLEIPSSPLQETSSHGEYPIQRRTQRSIYGHDVFVDTHQMQKGSAKFDFQTTPEEVDQQISAELSTGIRKFKNYPYEVDVLSTRVIKDVPEAHGDRMVVAAAYVLGEHYKNGLGYRVPKETAWNPPKPMKYTDENGVEQIRIDNEDETRTFIRVTKNLWKPGIFTSLIQRDDPGFRGYENIYQKIIAEEQLQEKLRLKAEKKVTKKQGDIVIFEPLATAAD